MKKEFFTVFSLLFIIVLIFFYPVIKGYIPFPGDLMVNLNPYNTISFNGYAPGGVPNKAQGIDVIKELYPWKFFAVNMLKSGQVPLWNPYNFSGNPLMANFQSGSFYPLNFLFLILSFNSAWTIYIFLIPLLAAFFLYVFLREINLGKIASLYGGVIFAFSSYIIVWLEYGNIGHTLLWFPLVLFSIEKFLKTKNINYIFLIILFLTFSLLAGYIQGFFYFWILTLIYFFIKTRKQNKLKIKDKIIFISALLTPFLLGSFQLLPTLELFSNSSRNNYSLYDIQKLLNPIWYSITVLAPDFFGNPASLNHFFEGTYIERVSYFGIIPFVIAISAYFIPEKKLELKIFLVFFIFSFLFSLDLIITRFVYLLPIPVVSTTVPTRILSIFVLSGAILSAFGLEFLLKKRQYRAQLKISILIAVVLFSAFILTFVFNLDVTRRNLFQPIILVFTFIALLSISKQYLKFKYVLISVIFMLTLFEFFRFFHKITPFAPSEYIYPGSDVIEQVKIKSGYNRYWGYNQAQFVPNLQLIDNTYLPDGHDALHLKSYAELLSGSKNGQIPINVSRSDSEIFNENEGLQLKLNKYRQKVFNILAVKYILLKGEFIEQDDIFKEVYKSDIWRIYENQNALPRAFITNKYLVIPDKKRVLENFFDLNFNEREYVILEKDPGLIGRNLKLKSAELIKYEPNRVIIKTKSDGNAILFLSDNNYPGWKAKVDGREENIYTANYTFRAVKVPKGEHFVEFYYFPESFRNGLLVSGFTTLFLIIIALYVFIKKKRTVK